MSIQLGVAAIIFLSFTCCFGMEEALRFNNFKSQCKESNNVTILDEALTKAVLDKNIVDIDNLINEGAIFCRASQASSCTLLMDALKKKDKEGISIIMYVLNTQLIKNPELLINWSNVIQNNQRTFRSLREFSLSTSPLGVAIDLNDITLIKHIFNEAHQNNLLDLIREMLFPEDKEQRDRSLKIVLTVPSVTQEYILDQAVKAGVLNEILSHKIDDKENLLTYAIFSMMLDKPLLLKSIENLLKYGRKIDNNQLYAISTDFGKELNVEGSVRESIQNSKSYSEKTTDPHNRKIAEEDHEFFQSVLKLINQFK